MVVVVVVVVVVFIVVVVVVVVFVVVVVDVVVVDEVDAVDELDELDELDEVEVVVVVVVVVVVDVSLPLLGQKVAPLSIVSIHDLSSEILEYTPVSSPDWQVDTLTTPMRACWPPVLWVRGPPSSPRHAPDG